MIHDTIKHLAGPIDELIPHKRNPRQGDVGAIAVSLRRNGQFRPIVVNIREGAETRGMILAGNHTWHAAKAEGWTEIARTFVDVDDAAAQRIMLADNRLGDLASMDEPLLAELLKEIVDGEGVEGLEGTGYDGDDLDQLLAEHNDLLDPPADDTGGYKEQYGVIVVCTSEEEQETVFSRLTDEGYECKVVTT